MKRILYFLAGVLALTSCFDDEGNYDYNPINEMSIVGFGRDTVIRGLYMVDTVRVKGDLSCTMDSEIADDDYIWRWELENRSNLKKEVIATTRNLDLPLEMTPGKYMLHLRVKDKLTGVVRSVSEPLNVELSFSKGLYVLSDRENGEVQLDMVAMIESKGDTIILQDMLKNSGLPTMHNAISVIHTGENDNPENCRVWVMSETGSYYLESGTMKGSPDNTIWRMFFTSLDVPADAHPVECYPKLAMGGESGTKSGYTRGFRLSDGSFIFTEHLITELYNNPINRTLQEPGKLIRLFPGCLYSVRYLTAAVFYDLDNECFIGQGDPKWQSNVGTMTEGWFPPFRFNQKTYPYQRTIVHMDNTRNPWYADRGTSYALMTDANKDYYIYAFNCYKINASLSAGLWKVKKEIATEIDNATKFLFSSDKLSFYYLVGSKIYCYSFNQGNEKCAVVADFGADEVTWWDTDVWTEMTYDFIWIATYNPSTGGTLMKFQESEDQNKLEWTRTSTSWGGFPKIKSVAWRNCYY